MSQQTIRTQRKVAELQTLMAIIQRSERTRLCAVCSLSPTYEISPGVHSLTCGRMQCRRSWLLREPWRCEVCKSLDFERVGIQADQDKPKVYHCGNCKKNYVIKGRTVETLAETEAEAEDA